MELLLVCDPVNVGLVVGPGHVDCWFFGALVNAAGKAVLAMCSGRVLLSCSAGRFSPLYLFCECRRSGGLR